MTIVATPHSSPEADELRAAFFRDGDAFPVLAGRSAMVEAAVVRSFDEFIAPALPGGAALLAVGGFGRRELFPHSDVDLLLLVPVELSEAGQRDAVSRFLQNLWDSGLRLGHSVRTPTECCEVHDGNVELSISLLDRRFLAGDPALFERMEEKLPRFFSARRDELSRQLCRLTRVRQARYSDTIYHLEPNVKEAPGGLRDYQLARWLSQLRNAQSYRRSEPDPFPELANARTFLYSVRCFLHYRTGRDSNLLGFDAQEELADQPFSPASDPAAWMRVYFRHARSIHRTAARWLEECEAAGSSLFSQFRDWRSRLSNAEFTVSRESVLFKSPQLLAQDTELVLRLFEFTARHGIRPAPDSEQRIAEHLSALEQHRSAPRPLWPRLEAILSLPNAAIALRSMHECGVLSAMFPEWKEIDCLVLRDFHHRYTVDEHTLVSIQEIDGLRGNQDPPRLRFAELLDEIERPEILRFALLFHDTGKATARGPHTEVSAALAEQALTRIAAPPDVRDSVRFLIERHLDFSSVLNSRDLGEEGTARFLAGRVETVERLKYLTLVTYADISAVHPSAMSPWRLDQLWRLYLIAYNELTLELDSDRIEAPASDSPEKAEFLDGFPRRYLLTHNAPEIEAHYQIRKLSIERGVAVDVKRLNGVYSLTVVTRDRPFLFASVAGALAGFGMNILKAEAFGNRHSEVLDVFIFEDPNRTLDLNPAEIDRLHFTVERVVLGRMDVKELLERRPRPALPSRRSRVEPRVSFDSVGSSRATLIEIVAQDRPGLLYDLARTISSAGGNIEVVLVDTEAHKAIDVFYVTFGGGKLTSGAEIPLREALLSVCRT